MNYSLRIYIYILCCSFIISVSAQPEVENCVWTTFTFENGKKASEGCLVDGQPEGKWIAFFESGILKSKGSRSEFELDGLWEFYHENGSIQKRVEFELGKKNGKEFNFNEQGNLLTENTFQNSVQVGIQLVYDPIGWLKKSIPFESGKPNGWARERAEDGRIITLFEYDGGRLRSTQRINAFDDEYRKTGIWMEWNSMERKKEEGPWFAGKRNGIFKFYDGFGQLDYLEKYEFGKVVHDAEATTPVDVRTTRHPNGIVATKATYSKDALIGIFRTYDTSGLLESGALYEANKKVAEGITDEEGNRTGWWVWLDEMGNKKASGNYLAGKEDGKWEYFNALGELIQEGFFKNGRYHGNWTWYYPNKSIHRKEQYRKGDENGEFIEWNNAGEILNQGVYQNGLKQGVWIEDVNDHREEGSYLDGLKNEEWKHLNADGKQSFKGSFIFGLPDGKHVFYQKEGGVSRVQRYQGGVKQGKWIFYDSNNLIEQTREYRQGELIKIDGQTIKSRKERRADRDSQRTKTP